MQDCKLTIEIKRGKVELVAEGCSMVELAFICGALEQTMGLRALKLGNSNIYTGNMVSKYMATGEFEKLTDKKYLSGGDYNMIGDIAVKESGHTISVLENGAKAKEPDSNVKDDKPQDNKPQVKVEYAKSYDKSLSGTYIVNTKSDPLTLRAGAGKSKTKLVSMKKGKEVSCYGYYTKVDGVKWYYIVCDGVTGFASSKYLKKK